MVDPAHRSDDLSLCLVDEVSHDIVGTVALADFRQPVLDLDPVAGRTRGHVRIAERISQILIQFRKLAFQLIQKPPQACFYGRAGVPRHQGDYSLLDVTTLQEPGTIQRVKTRLHHARRVADIVQPGRRHQCLYVEPEVVGYPIRGGRNRLHMRPADRQHVSEKALRQSARSLN